MTLRERSILILESSGASGPRLLEAMARQDVFGTVVPDQEKALAKLRKRPWSMLVAEAEDLESPLQKSLAEILRVEPRLKLIVLDRSPDVERAKTALRAGAEDYIPGPLDQRQASDLVAGHLPAAKPDVLAACRDESPGIVGTSQALRETLHLASRIASTSLPVLITGESGTGKELLSQFIHARSRRRKGPFVRVNCAALSESLLESELFGHEKGAFTGAVCQRKGRFERAHTGTLLLDEITETGARLQAQLLRVLEEQDLERLGGNETFQVDVRILATTNRDLKTQVDAGRFRSDLYYRLAGACLHMPSLRERMEDLESLIRHFVEEYGHESGRSIERVDPKMIRELECSGLPGNVRQLRNVVRTALALGQGPVLSLHDHHQTPCALRPAKPSRIGADTLELQELERRAILEALRRTKSHQAKAADLLGITDRTLREKLRRYRADGKWPRKTTGKGETKCQELPA
jgi:DNA-binding NtrC family response regulator